jgi:spermidine synthase
LSLRGRKHNSRSVAGLFDDYDQSSKLSRTSSPFLRKGKRTLSLHFNVFGVQSKMDTRMPDRLVLGYTRTMMGFLLFHPSPEHIGVIGLGGGSIPKYCYRQLPQTNVSVAEISSEVIALRDEFQIPRDDERFTIYCDDGADFVRHRPAMFDVLIVDGFDSSGQPPQLCSEAFYDDCYNSLTPEGILVVNVYEGRESILISRVSRSFQNRVITVGGEDSDNAIVFAAKGTVMGLSNEEFAEHVQEIERAAATCCTETAVRRLSAV